MLYVKCIIIITYLIHTQELRYDVLHILGESSNIVFVVFQCK